MLLDCGFHLLSERVSGLSFTESYVMAKPCSFQYQERIAGEWGQVSGIQRTNICNVDV
jgi:hypothetical protein